jgi:hypothetical protein
MPPNPARTPAARSPTIKAKTTAQTISPYVTPSNLFSPVVNRLATNPPTNRLQAVTRTAHTTAPVATPRSLTRPWMDSPRAVPTRVSNR